MSASTMAQSGGSVCAMYVLWAAKLLSVEADRKISRKARERVRSVAHSYRQTRAWGGLGNESDAAGLSMVGLCA